MSSVVQVAPQPITVIEAGNSSPISEKSDFNDLPSPSPNRTTENKLVLEDSYSDLPSDIFDEYLPSPTLVEPCASVLPESMRSLIIPQSYNLVEEGGESDSDSSSSSDGEVIQPSYSTTENSESTPVVYSEVEDEAEEVEVVEEFVQPLPSTGGSTTSSSSVAMLLDVTDSNSSC